MNECGTSALKNWHERINSHALHFNAGLSTQSLEVPIL